MFFESDAARARVGIERAAADALQLANFGNAEPAVPEAIIKRKTGVVALSQGGPAEW